MGLIVGNRMGGLVWAVVLPVVCSAGFRASAQEAGRAELIAETHVAMQEATRREKHDLAVRLGHKLVDLAPKKFTPPYNLACAYARKGDAERAIKWLGAAADRGFPYIATFLRDEDLDPIRQREGFAEVVAMIQKNSDGALEKFKKKAEKATVLTILPPGHDATKPTPLVVALHGYGSDARDMVSLWRKVAGESGAILIAPQAVTVAGRGYNWGVIEQAQHLIFRAIEQAKRKYAVDERRVVVTGFSQGGTMSFVAGLRFPEKFAGVIPMAAFYDHRLTPIPETPTTGLPRFFIMNGALDEEADNNRDAARRFKIAGVAVELRIYEGVGHALPANREAEIRDALRFVLDRG